MKFHSKWQKSMWHHEWLTCLIKWGTDTIDIHSDEKYLKQILHSRKTKAEIDTGNTIEYDFTSYQVR